MSERRNELRDSFVLVHSYRIAVRLINSTQKRYSAVRNNITLALHLHSA
jgi:hypothetical protein